MSAYDEVTSLESPGLVVDLMFVFPVQLVKSTAELQIVRLPYQHPLSQPLIPLHQTIPSLPLDIIDHITKILIDSYHFGTAASLNLVSKDVHSCTLATLWRTLEIHAREGMDKFLRSDFWSRMIKSEGRRYTW